MQKKTEFPFQSARRITTDEVIAAEKAVKEQFGIEVSKRERSAREKTEKYEAISIRLHPKVIKWAKKEADKRGVEYQTIINETLLSFTDRPNC